MCCQNCSRPTPNGETTPMPVMTTLRERPAPVRPMERPDRNIGLTIIERRELIRRPALVVLAGVCLGRRPAVRRFPGLFPLHVCDYVRGNAAIGLGRARDSVGSGPVHGVCAAP